MFPSEQEVWLSQASLLCWKKRAHSLIMTTPVCIECSLLPGSALSTVQGLSPCPILLPRLLVEPACNLHYEFNILIWFLCWNWYSENSPPFLARVTSKVNIHVHDVIALGLPQLEVGQVFLGSCQPYQQVSIPYSKYHSSQNLKPSGSHYCWTLTKEYVSCLHLHKCESQLQRFTFETTSLIEGVKAWFSSLGIPSAKWEV